jgi:hypothetical protein
LGQLFGKHSRRKVGGTTNCGESRTAKKSSSRKVVFIHGLRISFELIGIAGALVFLLLWGYQVNPRQYMRVNICATAMRRNWHKLVLV